MRKSNHCPILVLLQALENLISGMQLAYADLQKEEEDPEHLNLFVSSVSRLENYLAIAIRLLNALEKNGLDILLKFYSQELSSYYRQLCLEEIPCLSTLFWDYVNRYEYYCNQKQISPFPEEKSHDNELFSIQIHQGYKMLLEHKATDEEWPWVSRQHLKLCLYAMEQVSAMMENLSLGILPQMEESIDPTDCIIHAVNEMVHMGIIQKKYDFQMIYQKIIEMGIFSKLSIHECRDMFLQCELPEQLLFSESSMKRQVIKSQTHHPNWVIVDLDHLETKRLNDLASSFEKYYHYFHAD